MPIYDYRCEACGESFEKVIIGSKTAGIACPGCGSSKVERMASLPTLTGTSAKHDVLQREYKAYRKRWKENAYMPKPPKKKSSE